MEIPSLTIRKLQSLLRSKAVSAVEVVKAIAKRIEENDARYKCYLNYDLDAALQIARNVDVTLPLGGIPVAVKDVISMKGHLCSCASKVLRGYIAPYDATAIAKLRMAGAIPFGRTNCDEFAMGSSTENSSAFTTRNPWDTERIPGGSSGGSAAAVVCDEAIAALGSDTGGSIRLPAALSGCVGVKPSYGRVSRFGLVAYASSLEQIGTLTKSVYDAALLLSVLAGHDERDSTSRQEPVPDYCAWIGQDLKGIRLGVPKEYFVKGIDSQVEAAVRTALAQCESLGARIVEISLPHTEYAIAAYYIIATAEASANLARYDGVRYGHRADQPKDVLDLYERTRAEGFGEEVKRRIILGTYVLSAGYYDAYYLRAQKVRKLLCNDFMRAFESVDAIVCPTSPAPAFRIGEKVDDPLQMYLFDVFTVAANLVGACAISVPCGFARTDGSSLPIGMQLLGRPLNEGTLLKIAAAYEAATDWNSKKPHCVSYPSTCKP